jgi:hypothetical protein
MVKAPMLNSLPNTKPRPEISVVIPLVDPRGDGQDHMRTWTHLQTFPRERFQVVAVSNGSNPKHERDIARLLAPHDRLVQHASHNVLELYDAGARQADGRLLVLSEHHCLAHPTCLAEAAAYFHRHDFDGACFNNKSICLSEVARLDWRMHEQDLSVITAPGHWNKVMLRGFAIYRDVLLAAGGFDHQFRFFAELALGAKLHALGYRLGYAERVEVEHLDTNTFGKVLGFIRDFTEGEMAFLASHDPEYCERYFGYVPQWAQRNSYQPETVRRVFRELVSALWSELAAPARERSLSMISVLAGELLRRLPARFLPMRVHLALTRLSVTTARLRFAFWRFDEARRTRAHADTRRRMVHYVRSKCVLERPAADDGELPPAREYDVGDLSEARLIGFHGREQWNGESFRWTEPCATLCLNVPPGDYDVVMKTRSLRGAPSDFPTRFFWNGRRIPQYTVQGNGGDIHFALTRDMFVADRPQYLTIICRPLLPWRRGGHDQRRLGLPVFSVDFASLDDLGTTALTAKRAM